MKRLTLLFFVALLHIAGNASAQQPVERKGVVPTTRLEEAFSGHLTDLNGKYKFRVAEITFEPGAYIGEHQHIGPGVRFVVSGELTSVLSGKTTIYKAGDYFYEPGNMIHTVSNKTRLPAVVIGFDILPADWNGASLVPPKSQ